MRKDRGEEIRSGVNCEEQSQGIYRRENDRFKVTIRKHSRCSRWCHVALNDWPTV